MLPEGPSTPGVMELYAASPAVLTASPAAPGGASDLERRDAARGSLLTALSMLIGAFTAGVSAALGGRVRDLHP